MSAHSLSDLALIGLAVVSFFQWRNYRKLTFENPFDARINARMKQLTWVVLAMVGTGVFVVIAAAVLNTLAGIVIGGILEMSAVGMGWSIPTVRSELLQRSYGNARYSEEKLERMTSLKRAILINAPIAVLLTVGFIGCLVLFGWLKHRSVA